MPILAREQDCFPDDLFETLELETDPAASPAGNRCWWLIYTRSRREKELMRRLTVRGSSFFCPIIGRRTRSPSGRVRESHLPLFPGYVFLHGTADDRLAAVTTNCVSSVTPVADQVRLTTELARIRRLIASNVPITPEERLETGMLVRVTTGPLRGQEGVVIERRGKRRLLVAVDLLQRGASVDLDECDVQPA